MANKFLNNINLTAGLEADGQAGTSGQVLSSTGSGVQWINLSYGNVSGTGTTNNMTKWSNTTGGLTDALMTDNGSTVSLSTNGSSNTFDLSHTSGSGIALNITKGGNNEALVINKTSGSGNAVSITGDSYFNGDLTIAKNQPLLTINDTAASDLKLEIKQSGSTAVFKSRGGTTSTGQFNFQITNGTTTTSALSINQQANVGIGTTSPDYQLQVESTGNAEIQTQRVSGAGVLIQSQASAGVLGTNTNHRLDLKTNGGTRATILPNGNVGIGTTSPAYKLDVSGDIRSTSQVRANTNLVAGGYIDVTGIINHRDNIRVLNKLATNWITWATRDTSGSDSVINLSNIKNITASGNVGIGTTSPLAPLHVAAASNFKVAKIGNDLLTHYSFSGLSNHTLTLTCGSYYQAEVTITANQTNGGDYNNIYIRGIWSNNHESHHWDELENVGFLTGSSFTITVSENTTTNSGKLIIQHNYSSQSFSGATVRVTDFYGTHAYTLT